MNITEREISALRHALAKPQRPSARKRLRALRQVFSGYSIAWVARSQKVDAEDLRRWVARFRKSVGKQHDRKGPRHNGEGMTAKERILCRRIDEALQDELKPSSRRRLLAVRAVLQGERLYRVARANAVANNTVGAWIAAVRERGVGALVRKAEPIAHDAGPRVQNKKPIVAVAPTPRKKPSLGYTEAELDRLATLEKNQTTRRRLRALALVAGGMPRKEVAALTHFSKGNIDVLASQLWWSGLEGIRAKTHKERIDQIAVALDARRKLAFPLQLFARKPFGGWTDPSFALVATATKFETERKAVDAEARRLVSLYQSVLTKRLRAKWQEERRNEEPPSFNWHALRHFAISCWIDAGLPPKTVQTFAGHSSLQVTMDRYGHLFRSDRHGHVMDAIGVRSIHLPWPSEIRPSPLPWA